MSAVIYLRNGPDKDLNSANLDECRNWNFQNGYPSGLIFTDLEKSPRYAQQDMLATIQAGRVSVVVTPRLDELGGALKDLRVMLRTLFKAGVGLVCVREGIDTRRGDEASAGQKVVLEALAGFVDSDEYMEKALGRPRRAMSDRDRAAVVAHLGVTGGQAVRCRELSEELGITPTMASNWMLRVAVEIGLIQTKP